MKRLLILALILVCLSTLSVPAQKRELPDLPEKRLMWAPGKDIADSFFSEGVQVRVIKNEGVIVAVVCYDYKDHIACEVTVLNETDRRFDVRPGDFFMAGVKTDGKRDFVYSMSAKKLADKYKSRVNWGNFFRAFAAGMATTTSTSTLTGDVTGRITTTTPNIAAQQNAARANSRAEEAAKAEANEVLMYALLDNTVFPKKHVSGMVYFERKKFKYVFLNMIIDGAAYSFGFGKDE